MESHSDSQTRSIGKKARIVGSLKGFGQRRCVWFFSRQILEIESAGADGIEPVSARSLGEGRSTAGIGEGPLRALARAIAI
jgi:hypothetical protein